jgi:gliding motility-associated-like protein
LGIGRRRQGKIKGFLCFVKRVIENGNNDVLKVYGLNVKYAKLKIFNRWGEKVFESSNAIIEGWDGRYRDEWAPAGNYTYTLEAHYLNKKIKLLKGTIVLVR